MSLRRLRGWMTARQAISSHAATYAISFLTLGMVPVIQLSSFLLSGRMLSLEDFGRLILFQSSAAILVELAGGGMSELLIRNVARDPSSCRQSLMDFVVVGVPFTVGAILINAGVQAWLFVPEVFLLGALYGAVEIATQRTMMLWEQVALAHRHMRRADFLRLLPAVLRLLTLTTIYFHGVDSLTQVAAGYMIAALLAVMVSTTVGVRWYGSPAGARRWGTYAAGLPFALNQLLRAAQHNLDRILLSVVLSTGDVALYASAMKFVQAGTLPVATMLRMWYARIFVAGHDSIHSLKKLGLQLLIPSTAAASLSAVGLVILAPALPYLLGPSYTPSVSLVQIAAPLLVVVAISYLGGDVLTGTDRQYLRVAYFAASVALQSFLVFLLGPLLGALGAVFGLYVSATVFAFLCWRKVISISSTQLREATPD